MLTPEVIQQMKQNNVSANNDLTKQRTHDVLATATKQEKNEIETLSGLKRASINRVYASGSISAKIAAAIALTLNIDPHYLTGEHDERGECTDELLESFMKDKGYQDLIKKASKPARKPRSKPATAPSDAEDAPAEPRQQDSQQAERNTESTGTGALLFTAMTEEEAVYLLHSLFIQAKYSGGAQGKLDQVKALLI